MAFRWIHSQIQKNVQKCPAFREIPGINSAQRVFGAVFDLRSTPANRFLATCCPWFGFNSSRVTVLLHSGFSPRSFADGDTAGRTNAAPLIALIAALSAYENFMPTTAPVEGKPGIFKILDQNWYWTCPRIGWHFRRIIRGFKSATCPKTRHFLTFHPSRWAPSQSLERKP